MIAVIDYRMGNLLSVERGLRGVGADARITDDLAVIKSAEAIVLPGVGAFGDAAASMRQLGQMELVKERVREGVPFLGICLGQHLLCQGGVEGAAPGGIIEGLGLLPGIVDKLPSCDAKGAFYKIPHVGWNSIESASGDAFDCPLLEGIQPGEYFYFTHSYYVPLMDSTVAQTRHSIAFSSAVQFGECAFGVQFHPEKSSDAGAEVLKNFARLAGQI